MIRQFPYWWNNGRTNLHVRRATVAVPRLRMERQSKTPRYGVNWHLDFTDTRSMNITHKSRTWTGAELNSYYHCNYVQFKSYASWHLYCERELNIFVYTMISSWRSWIHPLQHIEVENWNSITSAQLFLFTLWYLHCFPNLSFTEPHP
jgi:hypothetical protein